MENNIEDNIGNYIQNNIEERLRVRKRIRSNAVNLATLVVNTAVEYKEELIILESDNKKLKRKNNHLKDINLKINEINDILCEELDMKNEKINKLISLLGDKNICYNCSHSLNCKEAYLCVYCQKWVCRCCRNWCQGGVDNKCITEICESCYITHNKCPTHIPDFPLEKTNSLLKYYSINRHDYKPL